MKRRKQNLSDKRSKRKIVAENRRLSALNAALTCGLAVAQVQIALVVASKVKPDFPPFEEGGIVLGPNLIKPATMEPT